MQQQIISFIKEVRSELSRVEWPTRSDFIGSTIVTLLFVLFFMIYLGIVDISFRWIIYDKIFSHVKI